MTRPTQWLVAGATLTAALAGTFCLVRRGEATHAVLPRGQGASLPFAPMATADDPPGSVRAGLAQTYTFESTYDVRLRPTSGSSPPANLRTKMVGEWLVGYVGSADGTAHSREVLRNVRLEVSGANEPIDDATRAGWTVEMQRPFQVVTRLDGRVRGVVFDKRVPQSARGLITTLVGARQLARPSQPTPVWSSTEVDATGEYEATYRASQDGQRIERRKTSYVRMATSEGLRPVASLGTIETRALTVFEGEGLVQGGLGAALEAGGVAGAPIARVMASEELSAVMRDAQSKLDATSTISIRLVSTSSTEGPGEVEQPGPVSELGTLDGQGRGSSEDLRVLGTATLADITERLSSLAEDETTVRRSARAQLEALFRLHPGEAPRAAADVVAGRIGERASKTVIAGLGDSATPPAQRALATILTAADARSSDRTAAAMNLGLVAAPTGEAVQALSQMALDRDSMVRSASALALGNAASELRESNPSAYQSATDRLAYLISSATTDNERVTNLRALGNSGDVRVVAFAEQAFRSELSDVRAAAVFAVRFAPGERADELVDRGLLDADARVRQAAVSACEFRPFARHHGALVRLARGDESEAVRKESVDVLGRVMLAIPGTLEVLGDGAPSR